MQREKPALIRRILAILASLAALGFIASTDAYAAGGLFDFLFGPDPEPRYAPPQPSAYPRAYPSRRHQGARQEDDDERSASRRRRGDSGEERAERRVIDTSPDGFCVRTCDGYFFPMIKSSKASRQQSCEFLCPSAPVEAYEGATIEQARNNKGERYASLPNAFSFRDKTTERCSCTDPRSSSLFFQSLAQNDPTLRSGDVVIEDSGAFVYNGSRLVTLGHAAFVPSSIRSRLHAMIRRNELMKSHEAPAPAEAQGSVEFVNAAHPTPAALAPH